MTGGQEFTVSAGQRSVEESVGFAASHRTRAEILAALHEGPATGPQLADILGQPRHRLRYHLEELLKDGSIEIAQVRKVANVVTHVYRVTRLPYYSEEDWCAMTMGQRQVTSALILQAAWAEALASLYAGKFHNDPQVAVIWNRILLDRRGREELAREQKRSWDRIHEIEAESAARRLRSKEAGTTYVVTSLGYERSRNVAPDPQPLETGISDTTPSELGDLRASSRSVPEAVSHSIAHRIRAEILAALHEGPATTAALGRMLGQPLGLLDYHVNQLLADGAIRVTATKRVRNFEQAIYAVVKLPFYSDREWQRLTPEERQVFSAIILRAAIAESMASLWAGKFHSDPEVMVAWNRILLDPKGRDALLKEQSDSYARICQIEADAESRLDSSDEQGRMYVVTLLGYERSRTSPPTPVRDSSD